MVFRVKIFQCKWVFCCFTLLLVLLVLSPFAVGVLVSVDFFGCCSCGGGLGA